MPAAYLPLFIDQGEDFSAQLVWTDEYDEPQQLTAPCRLDVKNVGGQTQFTLATPEEELPPGEIPQIGLSADIGLIQLHIERDVTAALMPGEYVYDLFVSVDDGDSYAGDQVQRILYGPVTVNKRVTAM